MAVLVTGGCGYVGTKLTRALLERTAHDVTVLDTQWFGNHLPADPRLTNISAQNNSVEAYLLDGGTLASDRTWDVTSLPYLLTNNLTVSAGATLTLVPGVVAKMRTGDFFEIDGKLVEREMVPGEAVHISPPTVHRMTALEDSDIFEVSTPELDDVVRLEDRYGREGTSTP